MLNNVCDWGPSQEKKHLIYSGSQKLAEILIIIYIFFQNKSKTNACNILHSFIAL